MARPPTISNARLLITELWSIMGWRFRSTQGLASFMRCKGARGLNPIVGIATPGPEVNFPPLFPVLIAGASFVIQNYEWAGRVVWLVLGALLPLPCSVLPHDHLTTGRIHRSIVSVTISL
jgi:hypothetical protein